MAKKLSKAGISTSETIQAWHVTQSVDALTGDVGYDVSISGSLELRNSTLKPAESASRMYNYNNNFYNSSLIDVMNSNFSLYKTAFSGWVLSLRGN